ncbi:MAG TPA: GFA family protein [Sphingobium sp.]|uniref:GFA family protein n=1 Tax=Sphingobium sp. TaxID=1912891 RepID=UPI002ED4705F
MPQTLEGSCRCGAIRFRCESHTPVPYQLCYCSICRKTAGGGGYAINLGGLSDTLEVTAQKDSLGIYRAEIRDEADGACRVSSGQRHYCTHCATALWLYDPEWPELVHPFASAIDSDLPVPPSKVHLMLRFKPDWVEPDVGKDDLRFDVYPEESLEDWHRRNGLWVE